MLRCGPHPAIVLGMEQHLVEAPPGGGGFISVAPSAAVAGRDAGEEINTGAGARPPHPGLYPLILDLLAALPGGALDTPDSGCIFTACTIWGDNHPALKKGSANHGQDSRTSRDTR